MSDLILDVICATVYLLWLVHTCSSFVWPDAVLSKLVRTLLHYCTFTSKYHYPSKRWIETRRDGNYSDSEDSFEINILAPAVSAEVKTISVCCVAVASDITGIPRRCTEYIGAFFAQESTDNVETSIAI